MRKDGSFIKTERLKQISTQIAISMSMDSDKKVSLEKILLWIEFNIGLSREKAIDYVDKVLIVKDWGVKDGFIQSTL